MGRRSRDPPWNYSRALPECISGSRFGARQAESWTARPNGAGWSGRLMRRYVSSRANRLRLLSALLLGVLLLMGASDNSSRIDHLGHQMMCMCSCNQILMECNHVGCTYSDSMRHELASGVDAGKSDDDVLAMFVEKYGTTVLAAPT